jgi:chemotaxis signal transduction protein
VTDGQASFDGRAAGFRRAFDLAFSRPARTQADGNVELLTIRVCEDPWALRLSEVAGLLAGQKIAPVPSAVPEFLGLVGFRGGIHPAYSLRGLLGYPQGDAPRWLVFVKAGDLVGLAFDRYEGYQSFPERDLVPAPEGAHVHARQVARILGVPRPVLAMSSLKEAINRRLRRGAPVKGELTHES